jgi:hypothetical protein
VWRPSSGAEKIGDTLWDGEIGGLGPLADDDHGGCFIGRYQLDGDGVDRGDLAGSKLGNLDMRDLDSFRWSVDLQAGGCCSTDRAA